MVIVRTGGGGGFGGGEAAGLASTAAAIAELVIQAFQQHSFSTRPLSSLLSPKRSTKCRHPSGRHGHDSGTAADAAAVNTAGNVGAGAGRLAINGVKFGDGND